MASSRHAWNSAVHEIRQIHGVDLTLDSDGSATLLFDEDIVCTVEVPADSSFVFIHAVVSKLPVKNRLRVMRFILRVNGFELPIPAAWLGLDDDTEDLILCASLPLDSISAVLLVETLSGYATVVPELRRAIEAAASEVETNSNDKPPAEEAAYLTMPIRI